MSTVEALLQQFAQVVAGLSTEAIDTAEKKLMEMEKAPNFLEDCLTILTEAQVTCTLPPI
jgi:hypothetical protein